MPDTASAVRVHRNQFWRGEGFHPARRRHDITNVVEIAGGEGTPPEPNWRTIFGRAADRDAAAGYWRSVISEMRSAEKLAVANVHPIKRLVVAYVTYDISAREVLKSGPVMKAKKTGVPTYNPWWTTMSNAASQAQAIEKELCVSHRERGAGAKVAKPARRSTGADRYIKPRG